MRIASPGSAVRSALRRLAPSRTRRPPAAHVVGTGRGSAAAVALEPSTRAIAAAYSADAQSTAVVRLQRARVIGRRRTADDPSYAPARRRPNASATLLTSFRVRERAERAGTGTSRL